MEYQKPIYFTIKASSLDEARGFVTVVSSDGTIVDWCHFSNFEQISEEEWKLVFIITKPYYYIIGEESVRYGYVTGILYGKDDGLCKKIKIEDEIRIKQEGCLFETVELISSNVTFISQECDSIEFINVTDTVYSSCSDESIGLVSNSDVEITQECEDVALLISYETIFRECEVIEPISSGEFTLQQVCSEILPSSNCNFLINQDCVYIVPKSNEQINISQICELTEPKSSASIAINQQCEIIYQKSNIAFSLSDNCEEISDIISGTIEVERECS